MPAKRTTRTLPEFDRAVEIAQVVMGLRQHGLTQQEIGRATGASGRSVRNWIHTSTATRRNEERLWALRDIVLLLRETLTPRGVGQWLRAPNRLLKGRRPIDVLAEGNVEAVREAAASYVEGAYV